MSFDEWYKANKEDLDAYDLKFMAEYLVSKGYKMPKDWADDKDNTKADVDKIKATTRYN